MKQLADDLAAAQSYTREYHEVIEEIRREADAFNSRVGTHDD
jgi:hypothetical protein